MRQNLTIVATLWTALLALCLSPPAHATTMLRVDVPEMTLASEWVVRARVLDVKSVDLGSEGRGIFTDVTLQIREVYRGIDVPTTYVLRLIGGRGHGDIALWIPGMPRFTRGEEVVLFLEATSLGHIPCGLGQGVWRLHTTPSGATWTQRSLGDVHLMRRDPRGHLVPSPIVPISTARLLDDLVAEVYATQLGLPIP